MKTENSKRRRRKMCDLETFLGLVSAYLVDLLHRLRCLLWSRVSTSLHRLHQTFVHLTIVSIDSRLLQTLRLHHHRPPTNQSSHSIMRRSSGHWLAYWTVNGHVARVQFLNRQIFNSNCLILLSPNQLSY